MEELNNAVELLGAISTTMEQISVVGISNQSRFVGCAEALEKVTRLIQTYMTKGVEVDG